MGVSAWIGVLETGRHVMMLMRRIGCSLAAIVLMVVLFVWSLPMTVPLGLRLAGVEDVRWSSIDIGFRHARIEALEIGEPPRQRVSTIDADYSFQGLWRGRLDRLQIEGLVVDVAYQGGLFSLDEAIVGGSNASANAGNSDSPVPLFADTLIIENSQIDVETPIGPVSIPFDGKVVRGEENLKFDLEISEAAFETEPVGRIEGTLKLSGHLPMGGAASAHQMRTSGRLDLSGAGLIAGEETEPIALSAGVQVSFEDGRLKLEGPIEITEGEGAANADMATVIAFDQDWRPALIETATLNVEMSAWHRNTLSVDRAGVTLSVSGALDDLTGGLGVDVEGLTARFGDVEIRGLRGQRLLDFMVQGQRLEIAARELGRKLSIDGLTVRRNGEDVLATGWFTTPWPARDEPWLRYHINDGRYDIDLALVIDPARIDIDANRFWVRTEALEVRLKGDTDGLSDGVIRIRKGRADFPSLNLALIGIESDLLLDDQGLAVGKLVPLTIRSLRPLDEPRFFKPLRLDVSLKPMSDRLEVAGGLKLVAKPAAALAIKGGYDIEAESGKLDLNLPPLAFDAGKVEPGDFSPILDGVLTETVGEVALDGEIVWKGGALESELSLLIRELGFAIGPARLARINSVIQFDSLAPPSTPPAQLLSVGILDVGLPLTDGLVSMRLRPDGQLSVDQLTWRLADGEIRAAPFTFGSDVRDLTMVLTAERLDLEALLRLTPLDELTGEGRIAGTLPLTIGATAAIDGGELAASGPGVIRYVPSAVPGVLQAGGESVTLMLQALENFQYDALNLTLDGKTDGDTQIGLHLKGANPELYDGYPVEFNLNLDGNLASLIQTNIDNYQIPDRIRERLQGFQQ